MQKTVQQYGIFGLLTGLTTSLIDSLFFFIPDTYFPLRYPLLLVSSNLIFWTCFAVTTGICLSRISDIKLFSRLKNPELQAVFYIGAFALTYSILGRISLYDLRPAGADILNGIFDHGFSLILVLTFLAICFFRKKNFRVVTSFLVFLPELVTVSILLFVCSNFNKLPLVKEVLAFAPANKSILVWGLYAIFVCLLFALYHFCFVRLTNFLTKKPLTSCTIMTLVVILAIGTGFGFAKQRHNKSLQFPVSQASPVAPQGSPNVFLIVLDTVRQSDFELLDMLDDERIKTFFADATVYQNCISTSSWTGPAHASLFTGLYPTEHGISMKNLKLLTPLNDKFETLAETFKENGYQTAAVVANCAVLTKEKNYSQGFDIYDDIENIGTALIVYPFSPIFKVFCALFQVEVKLNYAFRSAEDIQDSIVSVLDQRDKQPLFMFINYMDAHKPYLPPRSLWDLYYTKSPPYFKKLSDKILSHKTSIDYVFSHSQYKAEIAYLQKWLGEFLSELKRRNLYDSSLIVVTSDHGEAFGEHGFKGHGNLLYEEGVKVPLLIKKPNTKADHTVSLQTSLLNVYFMVLEICGLTPAQNEFPETVPIVAELRNPFMPVGLHQTIYAQDHKLMVFENDKEPELYNTSKDLYEKNNLYDERRNLANELFMQLNVWKEKHPSQIEDDKKIQNIQEISPNDIEKLKALGYIGG